MMYLFIGAIIGSLPSIYRRGKIKKFNPLYLLWVILGGVLAYTLDFFLKSLHNQSNRLLSKLWNAVYKWYSIGNSYTYSRNKSFA